MVGIPNGKGRRSAGRLALAALMVAGLAACGDDDADEAVADPPPAEETTTTGGGEAPAEAAFPVTVATKFGDVTVAEEPQRVVALGWGDAETALALGVQPVGASDWLAFGGEGVGEWADGLYDEAPELIGTLEPSYEAIAALQPDLILDTKSSGDQARYDLLSQIAPTIGVPEGGDAYLIGWEDQARLIATALGRAEDGDALVADVEARFEAAAADHPEFEGKTITVGARSSEGYGAYVQGVDRVDFVERLGFVNNPAVDELAGEGFSIDVAQERLDLLDADVTVVMPIGVDAAEITGDPLFQQIPSVADGRVVVIDDEALSKAFSTSTLLSLSHAIEVVTPLLADAVAGNGG